MAATRWPGRVEHLALEVPHVAEALYGDRDAHRAVIAQVTDPTWVPMRAATCLLSQHPKEAEEDALKWVADPAQVSLTTLVLGRLDTLPLDSATRIAQAALAGPHAEIAKVRIAKLRTPELKALATTEPAP